MHLPSPIGLSLTFPFASPCRRLTRRPLPPTGAATTARTSLPSLTPSPPCQAAPSVNPAPPNLARHRPLVVVVPHAKMNSDSNHHRVRGRRVTAQARMRESRGDIARTRAAPSAWVGQAACAAGPSRAHKAMGRIAAQYCTSFSFF
jgi:hypothetical protein